MAKVKSQPKSLVATDNRFPLTMALAEAASLQNFPPEIVALRKKELADLVSQSAKTFGFQSKLSLVRSLDFSVGLLSLALVHLTKGEIAPQTWVELIKTKSWKDLAKDSIAMIRSVKDQDEAHAYLFESEKDPVPIREHLRDFALRRDRNQQWSGYGAFLYYQKERNHNHDLDLLVRWLIKNVVKRPLSWKDDVEGPVCSDEALNTILFRACTGLGFNSRDIVLMEKDFQQVRADYDEQPAKWLKAGQKRYELLLLPLPENLLSAADPKWFQKHFEEGPPKVRKWDPENMRGITGIYYYQTYS